MVVWGDQVNVSTTTTNKTNTIKNTSHCSWVCYWGGGCLWAEVRAEQAHAPTVCPWGTYGCVYLIWTIFRNRIACLPQIAQ
jgi:hypothetical protein